MRMPNMILFFRVCWCLSLVQLQLICVMHLYGMYYIVSSINFFWPCLLFPSKRRTAVTPIEDKIPGPDATK